MVMAYIIFLNPAILDERLGTADAAVHAGRPAAGTALVAGIMTIAMGVVGNYPLALAAGLGINAIVAFSPDRGKGLTPAGAMGVIVLEGIVVTVLVLVGLREAIMNAVPLALKRVDRRRHRPVHPVHRLRQRRAHRRLRAESATPRSPVTFRSSRRTTGRVRLPARPGPDHVALCVAARSGPR